MQSATILVADDDAVARELLAEALRKEGYQVEAFASGEEVIARGREGRVDLVLTDIRMGAVDGLTVLRGVQAGESEYGGGGADGVRFAGRGD